MRLSRHTTGSKWTGTAHGEWVNIRELEEHTGGGENTGSAWGMHGECVGNRRECKEEYTGKGMR